MKISNEEGNLLPEYKHMLVKNVEYMNKECERTVEFNQPENIANIVMKNFPKCAVRSAMQEFNCENEMVKELFDDIKWSEKCFLYSLNDIFETDDYINCFGATFRPKNNSLVEYKFGTNIKDAENRFFRYLKILCFDSLAFNKAKCAAYNLRDECFDAPICIGGPTFNSLPVGCSNPLFYEQYSELYKMLLKMPKDYLEFDEKINFEMSEADLLSGRSLKGFADENTLSRNQYSLLENGNQVVDIGSFLVTVGIWSSVSYVIYKKKNMKGVWKGLLITTAGIISYLLFSMV